MKQNTRRSIGIDLGLTHFISMSNGMKIENPRWFRENQSKLKKAQRHLSRKKMGSKRREKQKLKVAKIHLKITNQRKWFHHNLSTWLVNTFDHIFTEDLNIEGMKKSNLAKSISDVGWASFIDMLKYKSNWHGRSFHKIDRFFPSSKTCSSCGNKVNELPLAIRAWTCPSCGEIHDRDVNAAKNILSRGLLDLYPLTSDELADYRHREEIRPEAEMPKASSMKCLVTLT